MKDLRKEIPDEEYDIRIGQARERALWELGDSSWAGVIVGAFLYPTEDRDALKAERGGE